MHSFRKLSVWRKAHALAVRVYGTTESISDPRFADLADQIRRSAVAIPASIAEGTGHETANGFVQYLDLALSSARELEYHALLAADVGAMDRAEQVRLTARIEQVSRMLVALKRTVDGATRTPRHRPNLAPRKTQ